MGLYRFTILGCGSSGGVPRIGMHWGSCDPDNPRNYRRRCSLLIERISPQGVTRVLIDTTPDLRSQLLDAHIEKLDAVLYTHAHADHVHGIDDLRQVVFNTGKRLPVYADGATQDALYSRFGYAFTQPKSSPYPPILEMHTIRKSFSINGEGGNIPIRSFHVSHGTIDALGFRIADLAYLPDVAEIYDDAWPSLMDLDYFIVDALRHKPHPTHAHLEKTLEWIKKSQTRNAVLTNMHIDMDYHTVMHNTPTHVVPAYDGMTITIEF